MGKFLFVILIVIAACTCGGRTECSSRAQISLLTSIHDDPSCRKLSPKGVLLAEAAKLLAETHNNKSGGYDLELTVLDTCGSITGALKAAMKGLVYADTNCLQPPYYLGIIGPDTAANAEAVQKVTSVLKVPHMVRRASNSPYLHHLSKESDSYLVQGALKIIRALKWKSFTLVVRGDEENEDDVQNLAKKLTMSAIAERLCVLVHDDDEDDLTSHIVHIGKPEDGFFSEPVNATVLVLSEGRLEEHLNHVNSTNTILLLEDSRNELAGLEARVKKSKLWTNENVAERYDAEELREVRWLEDAIKVYAKSLDTLCKKKKCRNPVNPVDWNSVVSNVLATHIMEAETATMSLDLSIKSKVGDLKDVAKVLIHKNSAEIHWEGKKPEGDAGENDDENDEDDDAADDAKKGEDKKEDDDDDDDEDLPEALLGLRSEKKETSTGCATTSKEIKLLHEDDDEAAQILVSEMDDSEWWTMIGTVSGVGFAMFTVGILAVYVVYTNIRGPVSKSKGRVERDTSLRRVGSEREYPSAGRNHRQNRGAQRRDSNRSIRSNMSDKSV